MKNKLFYLALALVFVAGLSLMLYPSLSQAYNAYLQSKAIAEYSQLAGEMDAEKNRAELEKARAHNAALLERQDPFSLPEDLAKEYENTLALAGQDVMSYIHIPSLDATLPIAHGTDEETLRDKIGHLEFSSLPVGGESTHCVISGHRGLPSAQLFTNIDHLEVGDKFYLHTLGQTLEYQVCHIAVVEPQDQRLLLIEEGQDLVTLVTCTPYGINSHRLLVRGIRTDSSNSGQGEIYIKNEITSIDVVVLVSVVLGTGAVVTFIIVLLSSKKKKGGKQNEKTDL